MLDVQILKTFSGFQLDINFTVSRGITALFGPSGSGKSLTLKCISGLLVPDQGKISLHNTVLFSSREHINIPPQKRKIGFVFQNYALFPHLSVQENIIYGIKHLKKAEQQEKSAKLLEMMRLKGLEKKKPAEISGGQQQRVALARTLAAEPEMILLDEPFSALDSAVKSRLRAELLDILGERNIPAIIVTHDLNEAYSLSNNLTIIDCGQILQSADKQTVINYPVTAAVARLIRTKNIFPGVVESEDGGMITAKTAYGVLHILSKRKINPRQEVNFFIRPHHIKLYETTKKDIPETNVFDCVVSKVINHIDSHTLFLRTIKDLQSVKDNLIYVKITDEFFSRVQPTVNKTLICHFPPECIGIVSG